MAGHFNIPPAPQHYPDQPCFSGMMKPCRFEGEVQNLEVHGKIPKEVHGTFYRVMPDPAHPPYIEEDNWINGDGCVSAFQFKDGHVDFKQRYVRTEKFEKEKAARKALLGRYRNKYTDAIEFQIRTTSNTNIIYFNGRLLACKEDGPPYAMDPETLETTGLWNFDGQLESATFTAHPKFDPVTRELVCFGYEAKGDGTPDVCYYTFNSEGKLMENVWLVAPVVAMIHDFAVTKNYVIFPIIPITCSVERLKAFGEHWQWDYDVPAYFGVLPRFGAKGEDVKWFRSPNAYPGHVANAYETPEGNIIVDLPIGNQNAFSFWKDGEGIYPDPANYFAYLRRFTIDPHSKNLELPPAEYLLKEDLEFTRIDDRFAMTNYNHAFMDILDKTLPTDFATVAPVMGGGYPIYNALGHLNIETGKCEKYFVGATSLVQEPVFIPRSSDAPEGDGFLMALVNRCETMTSDIVILDTNNWQTPAAVVKLPLRLRPGLHGNWVDSADVDGHPTLTSRKTNVANGANGVSHN